MRTRSNLFNDKLLLVLLLMNPVIYVFELKKIIYGCESYWSFMKDSHDFEEIMQEMINGQWYIELLKFFLPTKNYKDKK